MKFTDCVKLLILFSVPTLATFWPPTSSKSNRRAFTPKSLSSYTWLESSLKRDSSPDVKALVFLSHGTPSTFLLTTTVLARLVQCEESSAGGMIMSAMELVRAQGQR